MKNTFAYFKNINNYTTLYNSRNNANSPIDDQTICFIEEGGEIYTHGKQFGGGNGSDTTTIGGETINVITEGGNKVIDPTNLPKAGINKLGILGLKLGGGVKIDSNTMIYVDPAETLQNIKQYISEYPSTEMPMTPASKTKLGGVIVGDGIDVASNGKISANVQEIKNMFTNAGITFGGASKLSDLEDVTGTPVSGQVLKWNGSKWAPAADETSEGGSGEPANYVIGWTVSGENVTFADNKNNTVTINKNGGGSNIDSLTFYQNLLVLGVDGSEIPANTPIANSEYRGMVRAVSLGQDSAYLNNDYNTINDGDDLICPLLVDNSYGDAYVKISAEDIKLLHEADPNDPIVPIATREVAGIVKLAMNPPANQNFDITAVDTSDENVRTYGITTDVNDRAYVTVPWVKGVTKEYVDGEVADAIARAKEVEEIVDSYSTALNLLTEGTFADDLQAAVTAIDAAEGDLATLHGWIAEGHSAGPVFGDDSTYQKIYDYLNPSAGSYVSLSEAINTNLTDALLNTNGTLYSKVLKIVTDNSTNIDENAVVTNVKNEIISDGTFATQSWVASTVNTAKNAVKNDIKTEYTNAGLSIDSNGKVVIKTSDVLFDTATTLIPNKQSFANAVYDSAKGRIQQATATLIADAVNEVGLTLDSTYGRFALTTQNGTQTEGGKIKITDLATVIGNSNEASSSVWAGIMAKATVNGKTPAASIIADVNKSTGNTKILLNADKVVIGGTQADDGTVTGGTLIASRIEAFEAEVTNLITTNLTADNIWSRVNGGKYLYVASSRDNEQQGLSAVLYAKNLIFGSKAQVSTLVGSDTEASNDAIHSNYAHVSSWGAMFYPMASDGDYRTDRGVEIQAYGSGSNAGGRVTTNGIYGVCTMDSDSLTFIKKSGSKIYDMNTWYNTGSNGYPSLDAQPYMQFDCNNGTGDTPGFILKNTSEQYLRADYSRITLRDGVNTCTITPANGCVTSSDIRYKNIVDDINLSIEDVAAAPKFTYTTVGDTSNNVMFGTSAQYWRGLIPQSVVELEDGKLAMNYDRTALVAAISAAEEIVALKNEIAELKQQIAALTSNN